MVGRPGAWPPKVGQAVRVTLVQNGYSDGRLVAPVREPEDGEGARQCMDHCLRDAGVDGLEQPVPSNRLSGFAAVKKQGALPIILDEGVVNSVELLEYIKLGLLDGVAMKPGKPFLFARAGATPILASVKTAERKLVETAKTKSYMPIGGDPAYGKLVQDMILGEGGRVIHVEDVAIKLDRLLGVFAAVGDVMDALEAGGSGHCAAPSTCSAPRRS